MKPQHLLIIIPVVKCFTASVQHNCHAGRYMENPTRSSTAVMDIEGNVDLATREKIATLLRQADHLPLTVAEAQKAHEMPWKSSIDSSLEEDALMYMPYWEWQMQFMKENLRNLRALPTCAESGDNRTEFSYMENREKKARIVSACFASDEYRKIRMTYYDAGDKTQVFNTVWYPNPKYNLPVLGVDLLSFNRKKYLAIVDFQPIHDKEEDHILKFEHRLQPIKEKYDSLKGRMSSKFYDETQFFSQQMLFSRFEDESIVSRDLFPAYKKYVRTHFDLINEAQPIPGEMSYVLERQKAYDIYSAERDPATGLFASMFGKEWADGFVYDFLFSLSTKESV